jgi:hypothetical protein
MYTISRPIILVLPVGSKCHINKPPFLYSFQVLISRRIELVAGWKGDDSQAQIRGRRGKANHGPASREADSAPPIPVAFTFSAHYAGSNLELSV